MFNLSDYETVEERLHKWWGDHKDGKIQTELIEASANRFIVFARLYRTKDDTQAYATGLAEETVSARGVNQTSALENCETSAIGRALANAGYAAKGKRASREEMSKVANAKQNTIQVADPTDYWRTVDKQMPVEAAQSATEVIKSIIDTAEEIPLCKHGKMHLKEGSKNGRPFRGYVCTIIGNSSLDKCAPKWMKIDEATGKWVF